MDLDILKKKKILILGLGKEGYSTFKFLSKIFLNKSLALADEKEFFQLSPSLQKIIKKNKKIKLHLGRDYLESIPKYHVIIKSPGIPFSKIKPFLKDDQIVTSQTEIFLEKFKDKTIGITATKGKGTTASLIYQIIKRAKIPVSLSGNIGRPSLDYFFSGEKKKFLVLELSSHQLANLRISPHIAIFLNFYQDHLDYYQNLEEYFTAKANIARWQKEGDYFIFNYDSIPIRNLAKNSKATLIPFSQKKILKNGIYQKGNWIYFKNEKVFNKKMAPFFGDFYLENIMASIGCAKILNIPNNIIQDAIKSFTPLKHRLEYVGEFKKIKFFNDSLATIPETTIFAIKSLKNVDTLIAGGYERGQDFSELAKVIKKYKIRNLILFPQTGKRLKKFFENDSKINIFEVEKMKEAVKLAFEHTKKGKICLLSPASPSFGIFKDYKDRGNQFKKYIKQLSK